MCGALGGWRMQGGKGGVGERRKGWIVGEGGNGGNGGIVMTF